MKNKPLSGLPFEWMIGLRYTLSRRKGRADGFVSFISAMSMASIALGVMALIIVLSVMNGFQKEVRDKMLSVLPHAEVLDRSSDSGLAEDCRRTEEALAGDHRRCLS